MKITPELKLKLLNEANFNIKTHQELIELNHGGVAYKVPGIRWNEICLDLSTDLELYYECELWIKKIANMCRDNSYNKSYKVNIGPFEGLWPTQCDRAALTVNFLADTIQHGRKHWKDWFIQEGEEHAPQ